MAISGLAIAGIAAAVVGGIGSAIGGSKQAASSKQQSREQMTFQEWMSSTAHQRQVADLKKAGLNPILSARYGGAAGAAGSSARVTPNIIGNAVNSALATYQAVTAVDKMQAEIDLTKQSTSTQKSHGNMYDKQAELMSEQAALNQYQQINEALKIPGMQNEATLQETLGPVYKAFQGNAARISNIFKSGKTAGKPASKPLRIKIKKHSKSPGVK